MKKNAVKKMVLHQYQKNIANFIAAHPRCILSVDMGLGKTAAVLAWLDWYMRKHPNARGLIVAPKRVAEHQWQQEAAKWELAVAEKMQIIKGTKKQRDTARAQGRSIHIISRDNVSEYERCYFDFLIIDELTSFKSVKSQRSKVLQTITADIKIGLTGTFLANGAVDIYGQAAAVGLGWQGCTNFYGWRATFFRDALAGSGLPFSKWIMRGTLKEILHDIEPNIYTLTAADWLEIPATTETIHKIQLSDKQKNAIKELDAFLFAKIGDETLSFDEKQKIAKLQTLCNGFVYIDDEAGRRIVRDSESVKIQAVCDFVEECKNAGEPVLLFYAFVEEAAWITEELERRKIKTYNVKKPDFLQKWTAGEVDCLIAHPASAGHGLNLQHGGRVIVWSTLTYNYEYFAQGNARLARQGQQQNVQIHYFVAAETTEEHIVHALQKKDKDQKDFLTITKR